MDPITIGAIITAGAGLITGLSGSRSRRKAAQAQAAVAREQLAQDRLFKKLALRHGWAGRAAQMNALQNAPQLPMPGPSKTGSTMDALGQLGSSITTGYQSYRDAQDAKDKRDLYKKLQEDRLANEIGLTGGETYMHDTQKIPGVEGVS